MHDNNPAIKGKLSFVENNLLPKSVAAKSLRVSIPTLDRLIKRHGIKTIQIPGTNRTWVDGNAIESLVARSTGGQA
jgi:hypothetical protein